MTENRKWIQDLNKLDDTKTKTSSLQDKIKKTSDIVYTKDTMAKYLINTIKWNDNETVLEPCKGKGAFYNNLPKNVIKKYCEIDEGKDYLEFDEMVDTVISNPPFVPRKLFWDFQLKAMKTTRKRIYWLINISSLNVFTPNRLEEMNKQGWYIQKFHMVADKRWFGRYVFLEITKKKKRYFYL